MSTDCCIDNCGKPAHALGLCPMHYQRNRRCGSTDLQVRLRFEERFSEKVAKSDGCWTWTSATKQGGYGVFSAPPGWPRLAPRIAYELEHGKGTTSGLFVCHRCDNPPCVRPDHLFLGTNLDNVRDMQAKGRQSQAPRLQGERHPQAKLTAEQVAIIRAEYVPRSRTWGARPLALRYSVTPRHIELVVRRKVWSHI